MIRIAVTHFPRKLEPRAGIIVLNYLTKAEAMRKWTDTLRKRCLAVSIQNDQLACGFYILLDLLSGPTPLLVANLSESFQDRKQMLRCESVTLDRDT